MLLPLRVSGLVKSVELGLLLRPLLDLLVASRLANVLSTDVDPLENVLFPDTLEELHTNRTGIDIPDPASLAVVDAVGHTSLDGGVGLDVHIVTELVGLEVGGEVGRTTLAVSLAELLPRASLETE